LQTSPGPSDYVKIKSMLRQTGGKFGNSPKFTTEKPTLAGPASYSTAKSSLKGNTVMNKSKRGELW